MPPKSSLHLKEWLWDVLSCDLGFGAVVAIAMVLFMSDNKPVPDWPLDLTLNSVISLLAIISKAALVLPISSCLSQLKWLWFKKSERRIADLDLYDNASRGPWGSLLLLFRLRFNGLAFVGAMLTLLAILIDPFLQAIVVYPARPLAVGNATNFQSNSYVGAADKNIDKVALETANYANIVLANDAESLPLPPLDMKGAFFNALFTSPNIKDAPSMHPTCSTGNCTWAPFSSVGVCSYCRDLTDSAIYHAMANGGVGNWTIGKQSLINYSQQLQILPIDDMWYTSDKTALKPMAFHANNGTIAHFAATAFPTDIDQQTILNGTTKPKIAECMLSFCGQEIESRVANGVVHEQVISTWNTTTMNLSSKNLTEMGALTITSPDRGKFYDIDFRTWVSMQVWLGAAFTGSRISTWDEQDSTTLGDTAQAIQNILTTGNITAVMAGVAASMTNAIRTAASGSTGVTGVAFKATTFVHVRWFWLLLPVGLDLLGITFLISTIIVTARQRVPPWRSSSLAVMACGLDIPARRAITGSEDSVSGMVSAAEGVTGRLLHRNGHWMITHIEEQGLGFDMPVEYIDHKAASVVVVSKTTQKGDAVWI